MVYPYFIQNVIALFDAYGHAFYPLTQEESVFFPLKVSRDEVIFLGKSLFNTSYFG